MPSFIPATEITLHLAGVCANRIGVEDTKNVVERAALSAFSACRMCLATVETDPCFSGLLPYSLASDIRDLTAYVNWRQCAANQLNRLLAEFQVQLDFNIAALYGVTTADVERCERVEDEAANTVSFPPTFEFRERPQEALASFLVGVAFGRWKATPVDFVPTLLSAVPEKQPAAADGPARSIMVDDPGHLDDLHQAAKAALQQVLPEASEHDDLRLEKALGSTTLRS